MTPLPASNQSVCPTAGCQLSYTNHQSSLCLPTSRSIASPYGDQARQAILRSFQSVEVLKEDQCPCTTSPANYGLNTVNYYL